MIRVGSATSPTSCTVTSSATCPTERLKSTLPTGANVEMDLLRLLLKARLFGGHRIVASGQKRNLVVAGRARASRSAKNRSPALTAVTEAWEIAAPVVSYTRPWTVTVTTWAPAATSARELDQQDQAQRIRPRLETDFLISVYKVGLHTPLLEAATVSAKPYCSCLCIFLSASCPFMTRVSLDSESSRCCASTAAHCLSLPAASN